MLKNGFLWAGDVVQGHLFFFLTSSPRTSVKLPGSHAMVDMVKEQCSQEPNIVAGVVVKIIEHCNMLMINYNSTEYLWAFLSLLRFCFDL